MKKGSKVGVGVAIGVIVAVAVLVVTSFAIVPIIGGSMVIAAGGPLGALADEDSKKNADTCTVSGMSGAGTYGTATGDQNSNARIIIGVAKGLGYNEEAQTIALMTALQESTLRNLSGGDRDSIGLFQQRPSQGWGQPAQLNDPVYATTAFLEGVDANGWHVPGLKNISGWETMEKGRAAQEVQKSAFPGEYTKHEAKARALIAGNQDAPAISPGGAAPAATAPSAAPAEGDPAAQAGGTPTTGSTKFTLPVDQQWPLTSGFGPRSSPGGIGSTNHKGQDFGAPLGTPMYAALEGDVVAAGDKSGFGQWVVINHTIDGQLFSTVYGHMPPSSIKVTVGQHVAAGTHIADVGQEGRSTGAHLHFEVWAGGRLTGTGKAVDPKPYLEGSANPSADAGAATGGTPMGCGGSSNSDGTFDPMSVTGSAGTAIQKAVAEADKGTPYSWGGGGWDAPSTGVGRGANTVGFDCSGLTRYAVYQATGQQLPRTAKQQYAATSGNVVARPGDGSDKLQPGDLLYWGNSAGTIHHTGMYIGGGQMVEASTSRQVMRVSSVETRLGGDFFAATRLSWSDDGGDEAAAE